MKPSKTLQKLNKHMNKNGKIKGDSKKETKKLRAMCEHHRINKKGKVIPTLFVKQGRCYCIACERSFEAKWRDKEEFAKVYNAFLELVDQAAFANVQINGGKEFEQVLCDLRTTMLTFKKGYKNIRAVAQKSTDIKKKIQAANQSTQSGDWQLVRK